MISGHSDDPKLLECLAARLVAHLTSCAAEHRDFGGAQGSADLALLVPSGSDELGLLEVTSVWDDLLLNFDAAGTLKLRKGLGSDLQYLWSAVVPHPKPGQLNAIATAIVQLLKRAEAVSWSPRAAHLPQVMSQLHYQTAGVSQQGLDENLVRELLQLGIEWLSAIPARGRGAVSIKGTRDVYGSDPEAVAEAVTRALGEPDNLGKVKPASAAGRRAELFVWLMEGPTTLPIRHPGETGIPARLPASTPALPTEVTRVWVASGLFNQAVPMWSLDASGWRDVGAVAIPGCAQHKGCNHNESP